MRLATRPTTLALLALLPLGLAFDPRADALAFGPEDDSSVSREVNFDLALYLDDARVTANGQEVPVPTEELGSGFVLDLSMVVLDRFVSSRDGRAIELVRTYEEVEGRAGPEGETEAMDDVDEIVDLPVRFRWDEEAGEYDVTWADGDRSGDDALLEDLHPDMDFTMLLPRGEVEDGETWTVSGEELGYLFFPGGMPGSQDDADVPAELIEEVETTLAEAFKDFEVRCTYTGSREEGDARVGEIAFEFDGDVSIDVSDLLMRVLEEQLADQPVTFDLTAVIDLEFDGNGALLWNPAAARAQAFRMLSEVVVMLDGSADVDAEGQSMTGEAFVELSGTGRWGMTTR